MTSRERETSRAPTTRLAALHAFISERPRSIDALVFLLALVPRLFVATSYAREPVWDGHYYHFGATRIAAGFGYSDEVVTAAGSVWHPWCHYPVGYSGFLAIFYWLFGPSASVATVVGAVVGAITAACVWRLAATFLSPIRALAAGLLCAFHPGLILYSGLVMTEPLAGSFLVIAPLVFLHFDTRGRTGKASVLSGLLLGLATLVRPQSILNAPLLGILGAPKKRLLSRLFPAALALGVALLVVLPWSLRNCAVMDDCAFVSTNTGWNLAIGSSPRATGRFEPLRAEDGCRVVTGQVQQDRCWAKQAVAWIEADPVRWLELGPSKLSYTFDHQSFAVGYLAQADPEAWPEQRRQQVRTLLGASQYVLILFAALGTLLLPLGRSKDWLWALGLALILVLFFDGVMREPVRIWPLAVLLPLCAFLPPFDREDRGVIRHLALSFAGLVLVHFVFFGEDRYQITLTPALCVLAAAAGRFPTTGAKEPQAESAG